MSGGETRQNPLPKGQFRDRAESERQRMTNGPRMVTYILNRPLNAQTMHIFRRRDCILLHTPFSGGHISYFTHVICYVLTCTLKIHKNSPLVSTLVYPKDGIDGLSWITKPAEFLQALEALPPKLSQPLYVICYVLTCTISIPKNFHMALNLALHMDGISGLFWMTMPAEDLQAVEALYSYRGQDSTSLPTTSRSTQAGLRSSLGNIALPTLLSQLRQELKKGPALIFITVYRHVVIYVGLTLKVQNGTAILTDIATQAIKPKGHSPASPLAVTVKNHLGTVRFIRSVSKLGWDLQQVFLTIGKLKLIQAAPGEPFLPFPREGVG